MTDTVKLSLRTLDFKSEQFDVIALIYAHFPARIKSSYHKTFDRLLKTGGLLIFEAFSKKQLDYAAVNHNVGGPKDLDSLFSIAEIQSDFPDYEVQELAEMEIELSEGLYHNGTGSVI